MDTPAHPGGTLFAIVVAPLLGVVAGVALACVPALSLPLPLPWLLGPAAAPLAVLAYGRANDLAPRRTLALAVLATAIAVIVLALLAIAFYVLVLEPLASMAEMD